MVRALDTKPKGPRFNSQPVHYQVTTLGKLLTYGMLGPTQPPTLGGTGNE